MIITLAFVRGFQDEVAQKVFSFWGHVRIQEKQPFKGLIAEETPLVMNGSLEDRVRKDPRVEDVHAFATKYGILKTREEIEGVMVKGFDSTYNFQHLRRFIREGRAIRFNDSTYSREIVISSYTAAQLKLRVNDAVLIYFIRPGNATEAGEPDIRPDKLTITGIYSTGIEEFDKTFAIADIQLIRRLNDWDPDQAGGYEIFLKDYKQTDAVTNGIYEWADFPPTWDTQSVRDISPNIFDWLNMQDYTGWVLIGFMAIVAVINLITCLIVLVLERIRMIGILKALGATDWTVQQIFLRHSLLITLSGIILGALFGLGFLFLQKATGFIKLDEQAYYISEAAVTIVWWQVGAVCGGTLLVCFLVLMVPSLLVRRIQPVKAIGFR